MKVLIVNSSEITGGAAVAANRLKDALINNGIKAKMMVMNKSTDDITVVPVGKRWLNRWHFLWERMTIFLHLHLSHDHLWEIDIANAGTDITTTREFKEADVVHLHWINQGMMSLKDIRKILLSGKPVVWTMHDLWAATAICHYTRGCNAFTTQCRRCGLLPGGGSDNDLASRTWRRKEAMLGCGNMVFVACSRWLADQARQSGLLKHHTITDIPNTIDTRVFCRKDKAEARRSLHLPENHRIVLFASQKVTDERKGMSYLVEAVEKLVADHPQMKDNTTVAVLGSGGEDMAQRLALPVVALGYMSTPKDIATAYNAADVFVIPSLEDNLPNTVMEAMACGVPCLGFKVGGIPEMITHGRNGYVAQYKSTADLAHGLHWLLCEADAAELSHNAVVKVQKCYSQHSVALRYTDVYSQAIALTHYHL